MNKITICGVSEMTSFAVECSCGEMIFSHQFDWVHEEQNNIAKGQYICPQCVKFYNFQLKKGVFTMLDNNVFNN